MAIVAKAAPLDAFLKLLLQSYSHDSNAQPLLMTNLTKMAATLSPPHQSDAYVRLAELSSRPNVSGVAHNLYVVAHSLYVLGYHADSNSIEALYGMCATIPRSKDRDENLRMVGRWTALDATNALPHYLKAILLAERKDCKRALEEVRRGNALGVAQHRPLYLRIFQTGQLRVTEEERTRAREEFFLRQMTLGSRLTVGYMALRECAKATSDGDLISTLRDLVVMQDTIGLAEPVLPTTFIRSSILAIETIESACQLEEGLTSEGEVKAQLMSYAKSRRELLDTACERETSEWNSEYVARLRDALRLARP